MGSILLQTQAAGSVSSLLRPAMKERLPSIPTSWKQYKVHGKVHSRMPFSFVISVPANDWEGCLVHVLLQCCQLGSRHTAVLRARVVVWEFWRTSLVILSLDELSWLLACLCKTRLASLSHKDLLFQVSQIQHPPHLLI